MLHDFSPFLVRFSGDLGIRWYGLSYMMGFVCAYLLFVWMARRQKAGLTPAMVGDFVTYGAIGILVGGRLGYALFYSPDLFLRFRPEIPYWGVLAVNEGGMASHGGMIGLVVGCFLYARKHGLNQNYLYDLVALAGPIGIFFGRLANFVNGELLGRPCDPSMPFAMKFPQEILTWPSDSLAKVKELAPAIEKIPGLSAETFLEMADKAQFDPSAKDRLYGFMYRIIESVQNGNEGVKEVLKPILTPRHPSQLYAALGEGLLIFIFLFVMWRKPRKPGVIGSTFVVLYAIMRIITEQFRLPDAHIGYQLLHLTRGQWLSIGMLVIGLGLLLMYSRREGLKLPGWNRGQNLRLHRR